MLDLKAVDGIRLGTACAGIKTPGRKDLVLIELVPGTRCAAVFTRNAFCAAPVVVAREHLLKSTEGPRYLLVNTGNANAGTGKSGIAGATACAEQVAQLGETKTTAVLPFSTGVIGEPLPVRQISAALPAAFEALTPQGWADAAEGILTTDTRAKGFSIQFSHARHN